MKTNITLAVCQSCNNSRSHVCRSFYVASSVSEGLELALWTCRLKGRMRRNPSQPAVFHCTMYFSARRLEWLTLCRQGRKKKKQDIFVINLIFFFFHKNVKQNCYYDRIFRQLYGAEAPTMCDTARKVSPLSPVVGERAYMWVFSKSNLFVCFAP